MAAKVDLYFDEPLIRMSVWNRIIVRIIIGILSVVSIVLTTALLISSEPTFFWLGCFFLIFLFHRLTHKSKPISGLADLPKGGRVNAANFLLPSARDAIILAHEKSILGRSDFALELAASLIEHKGTQECLGRLEVDLSGFREKLKSYLKETNRSFDEKSSAEMMSEIAKLALIDAVSSGADFIGNADLFSGLAKINDPMIAKLFGLFEIKPEDFSQALIFGHFRRGGFFSALPKTIGGFASAGARKRAVNRAWTSRPTPTFDRFAVDYSNMARAGKIGLLIGHEDEYERLLNILARPVKPNALLVGEPGTGKDAVIAHLAYMISKDRVPKELFDKRLVSLEIGRLISGAEQSELQSRIQRVFDEIYQAGNIILHIPDIHNLSKTADEKGISAASVIVPLITTNDFPLIGTTSPKEYKRYIESDSAFAQAFDAIRLESVSKEEAVRILIYDTFIFENLYKTRVTLGAIRAAVDIADKYFKEAPLPGSAISLLKEALGLASRRKDASVSRDDIISVAEARVNIPIRSAGKDEAEKLLNLEKLIHEKLVDQEAAVESVAQALREYRSGLGRRGGPIGSFLFVGPTGVGKTELSKILSKIQFGSEEAMIRFDMSEYQDKQSVFQFIGSPDGKVAGILTDRVLEKPYSLILLDEFEKAHADILNIFLQVFDDGRLTDNFGRVVSFENTIIIATSNAHSAFIKEEIEEGKQIKDIATALKKKLVSFFKPELLNRFSGIVVFKDLSKDDIKKIAGFQLKSLSKTIHDSQGVYLEFPDDVVGKIAELGYDPVFGARPLRQVISDKLKDPLSKMILGRKIVRGSKIHVELENGEIKLIAGKDAD